MENAGNGVGMKTSGERKERMAKSQKKIEDENVTSLSRTQGDGRRTTLLVAEAILLLRLETVHAHTFLLLGNRI